MGFSKLGSPVQGSQPIGAPVDQFPVLTSFLNAAGEIAVPTVTAGGALLVDGSAGGGAGAVWGPDAIGAAPTHPPVFVGGYDAAGNIQPQRFVTYADINGTTGVAVTEQRVAADIHVQDTGANAAIRIRSALSGVGGVGGSSLLNSGVALYDGALFQAWRGTTGGIAGVAVGGSAQVADGQTNTPALITDIAGVSRPLAVAATSFNGASLDRTRSNVDVTLLASASRTTTQTSADITTYNLRGINVILDMTVVGTGSVTVSIDGKDPASGKYYNLLTGAAIITNSTNVYKIGDGLTAVANAVANDRLPRTIRIVVTANNGNAATYSCGYSLLV
jgi:hypothetical protein